MFILPKSTVKVDENRENADIQGKYRLLFKRLSVTIKVRKMDGVYPEVQGGGRKMKKFKRLAGIFLTLVLMLECISGVAFDTKKTKAADGTTLTGTVTYSSGNISYTINNGGKSYDYYIVNVSGTVRNGQYNQDSFSASITTTGTSGTYSTGKWQPECDFGTVTYEGFFVEKRSLVSGVTVNSVSLQYQEWNPSKMVYSISGTAGAKYMCEVTYAGKSTVTKEYMLENGSHTIDVGNLGQGPSCMITSFIVKYAIDNPYLWLSPSINVSGGAFTGTIANTSSNFDAKSFNVQIGYVDATGTGKIFSKEASNLAPGGSINMAQFADAKDVSAITLIKISGCKFSTSAKTVDNTKWTWVRTSGTIDNYTVDGQLTLGVVVDNKSTDKAITSITYQVDYTIDGTSKSKSYTINEPIDANISGKTSSRSMGDNIANASNFSFEKITVTNVLYETDTVTDAEVNGIMPPQVYEGTLYRKRTTWARVKFGTYNGEPIIWRVGAVTNNNTVELIADQAIEAMPYSYSMVDSTWENSAVKAFLNSETSTSGFMAQFTDAEKAAIVKTEGYDAVQVPTIESLKTYKYYDGDPSTLEDSSKYVTFAGQRNTLQLIPTTHASENLSLNSNENDGYCAFFLKAQGMNGTKVLDTDVQVIDSKGSYKKGGWKVYSKKAGVVPVIRVMTSACSFVDSVTATQPLVTGGTTGKDVTTNKAEEIAKPVVNLAKIGSTKVVNKVTYKVTAASDKKKTVAVVGVKKSLKTVTIPSTIKIDGVAYKVTAIKADAFKNAKKTLKSVVITSKNIVSMSKSAFKGLKAKTKIKVPSSLYKKYKSWIAKSNKKVTVKKSK